MFLPVSWAYWLSVGLIVSTQGNRKGLLDHCLLLKPGAGEFGSLAEVLGELGMLKGELHLRDAGLFSSGNQCGWQLG